MNERSTRMRRAFAAITCLLVWASRAVLPGDIRYVNLDRSWAEGLGYALEHGWQFGVDTVFTFGPLGSLSTGVTSPGLFWIKVLAWEGAFQLLAAVVITAAIFRIERVWLRVLAVAWIVLQPLNVDAYTYLSILAALVWLARARKAGSVPIPAAVLAGLSLVKFSFAVAAVPCVLGAALIAWRSGSRRPAFAILVGYVGLLLCGWLACGQSMSALPIYVERSLQISGGYGEAMSLPGPPWTVPIALLLIGTALFDAGLRARSAGAPDSKGGIGLEAAAYVALLGVSYKAGFVRALGHTPIFFQFMVAAPLLFGAVELAGARRGAASLAARLVCAALGLLGLRAADVEIPKAVYVPHPNVIRRLADHAAALAHPLEFRKSTDSLYADEERWMELPRTREVVGAAGIDMISYLQVLLFHNGLAWKPRPVFQSYVSFSPALIEANGRFLEGPRAPEFVLFLLQTIDDRLPTMDDAAALRVLVRDYEPVLQEKSMLLFRRAPRPGPRDAPEVELRADAAFGEWIDLRGIHGACHLLRLDLRRNFAGSLWTALDAAPEIDAEIELDDGRTVSSRVVPGMMRAGVLLDPVLRSQKDVFAWLVHKPVRRPVGFRLRPPRFPWMYPSRFGLEILRDAATVPPARPGLETRLVLSILPSLPAEIGSERAPGRGLASGEEILLLSPTSWLSFDFATGARRLRARFVLTNAQWDIPASVDAVFRVALVQPGRDDRILFERHVDPAHVPEDRLLRDLDLRFDADSPGKLVLSSRPGATSPSGQDCAGWAMIRLE